ncbi:MAG: hypothetical protein GY922_00515 [Proteobacteria bacterium]|nr:hypothetical protein [Pseudomonadota bacterium]
MKESDAKTKWCHRDPTPERKWFCLGSGCAAWEADQELVTQETSESLPPNDGFEWVMQYKSDLIDGGMTYKWYRYYDIDSGDCGLKTKYLECGQ